MGSGNSQQQRNEAPLVLRNKWLRRGADLFKLSRARLSEEMFGSDINELIECVEHSWDAYYFLVKNARPIRSARFEIHIESCEQTEIKFSHGETENTFFMVFSTRKPLRPETFARKMRRFGSQFHQKVWQKDMDSITQLSMTSIHAQVADPMKAMEDVAFFLHDLFQTPVTVFEFGCLPIDFFRWRAKFDMFELETVKLLRPPNSDRFFPSESLEMLLELIPVTKYLNLQDLDLSLDFKVNKKLGMKYLRTAAKWFTMANLMESDCIVLHVRDTILTANDLNVFMRQWIKRNVSRRLAILQIYGIEWTEEATSKLFERVEWKPWNVERERQIIRYQLGYDLHHLRQNGKDVVRNDGQEATVVADNNFFRMIVWDEDHMKNNDLNPSSY